MKKIIAILLTVLICFGLTGCAVFEGLFAPQEDLEVEALPQIYEREIVAEITLVPEGENKYETTLSGLMIFDFYPKNVTLSYNGYDAIVDPVSVFQAEVVFLDGTSSTYYVAQFNRAEFMFEIVEVGTKPVSVSAYNNENKRCEVYSDLTLTSYRTLLENIALEEKYNTLELIDENKNVYSGYYIWSDGVNSYYSYDKTHFIFNKTTNSWDEMTWNGLESFWGSGVWTDGENVYYSGSTVGTYLLNKETSTWQRKTWNGLDSLGGSFIWSDGENIYYSKKGETQYVLNRDTDTWEEKTWGGFSDIHARYVWSDGENIYYSESSHQYVLNKDTSTWEVSHFSEMPYFQGDVVWSDGENVYYSSYTSQQILSKNTKAWKEKTWKGIDSFSAGFSSETGIWTDGEYYYLTTKYQTYRFVYR